MFKFQISTALRFGSGESENLSQEIISRRYNKCALIIDKSVFTHYLVKKSIEGLRKNNVQFDTFINEAAEPTYTYLESFRSYFAGKTYDCLIGIGGGSTIDLAKGIAVLLTNEGCAISYKGFPVLKNRPIPVIAIPTTAGSGSEATYNAVFTDDKEKKKLGINTTLNFPVCAVVDPLITLGCPESVTASSGADALVHALESYVHKNHSLISRMYSMEAFRLLFNGLSNVMDNPQDILIRENLALGAYLAGIALVNSGSGPSGAFSYPLGVLYNVPHGYAGAIFISAITKINIEKGYTDYTGLYDLIDGADRNITVKEKNIIFSRKIDELMDKLRVPRALSRYNLGANDISLMINQYDILRLAIAQNPVEINKNDVSRMMLELA